MIVSCGVVLMPCSCCGAAAAWDKDGGEEGHAEVVKLMQTALDSLEDDVEEVCILSLLSWRGFTLPGMTVMCMPRL